MDNLQLMQRLQSITHRGGGRWYLDEAEDSRRIVIYTANHCFNIIDNAGAELLEVQLSMVENSIE